VLEQAEFQYDANGNQIFVTGRMRFHDAPAPGSNSGDLSAVGNTAWARVSFSAFYYDRVNRLTDSVDVGTHGGTTYTRETPAPTNRSTTKLITRYDYDDAGLLASVTDPRNIQSKTFYDILGRTIKTIAAHVNGTPSSADDQTIEYTYDGLDHVLTMKAVLPNSGTNSVFQTTQYIYGVSAGTGSDITSNDPLREIVYPDKSGGDPGSTDVYKEKFAYDPFGERKRFTDRNGTRHDYEFDAVGRLTSDVVTVASGNPKNVDTSILRLDYSYDGAGRPFKLTSYSSTSGASTDIVNQIQREYNGYGQLTKEYQEHGGDVETGNSPYVAYLYSEGGSKRHVAGQPGSDQQPQPAQGDRVSQWPDAAIRVRHGALDTGFGSGGTAGVTWSADAAENYSVAIQADGKIVLGGAIAPSGTTARAFAVARLNADGTADTSFSDDGMQSTDLSSGANDIAFAMRLAADGRTVAAGYAIGTNADFAVVRYTADGELDDTFDGDGVVTTSVGSTDMIFGLWIGPDNKITAVGKSGNDFALARYKVSGGLEERLYVQGDANHNVTSIVDVFGEVKERFAYDPYGSAATLNRDWSTDGDGSDYGWTHLHQGLRLDADVGLYDNRMRPYDPSQGRFISADPLGYPDGVSRYEYVAGGSTLKSDPFGLDSIPPEATRQQFPSRSVPGAVYGRPTPIVTTNVPPLPARLPPAPLPPPAPPREFFDVPRGPPPTPHQQREAAAMRDWIFARDSEKAWYLNEYVKAAQAPPTGLDLLRTGVDCIIDIASIRSGGAAARAGAGRRGVRPPAQNLERVMHFRAN
jgi:uncharacterized delta-60 repeat protein/RHS repeat-associated protein